MRKIFSISFSVVVLFLCLLPFGYVHAQNDQETLEIRLNRDFGYGGIGDDIQGLFSIHASGPDGLERVDFMLDGEIMGSVLEIPFRFQFQTDDYPPGVHTISASGLMNDGTILVSNDIAVEFVTSENSRRQMVTMIGTLLIIVIGGMALAAGVPFLLGRRSKSSAAKVQSYGFLGGAICSKCGKPFSRHIWGLNMVVGKLDRCPHCGKWSLAVRASPEELRFAESMLLRNQTPDVPQVNSDTQLQKDIDNSKYLE